MTSSTPTNMHQSSNHGDGAARAEALSWLAAQLSWEQRLCDLKEAHAISQATSGEAPTPVAASANMGDDRDKFDLGVGVAHGMEAVRRLAG
jgi:hypothetical protein